MSNFCFKGEARSVFKLELICPKCQSKNILIASEEITDSYIECLDCNNKVQKKFLKNAIKEWKNQTKKRSI